MSLINFLREQLEGFRSTNTSIDFFFRVPENQIIKLGNRSTTVAENDIIYFSGDVHYYEKNPSSSEISVNVKLLQRDNNTRAGDKILFDLVMFYDDRDEIGFEQQWARIENDLNTYLFTNFRIPSHMKNDIKKHLKRFFEDGWKHIQRINQYS